VHRRLRRHKLLAVMLVVIPLWVSMLLRIFAWKVILGENGFLNSALIELGLIETPSSAFLYTRATVLLTLTYVAIPFVFVTTYTALERIPPSLLEASYDAGADGWRTFAHVVWPLAKQGVAIGFGLALLLAVGDYLTPSLVGGLSGTMIGSVISSQFGLVGDWPLGAAMAVALLVTVGVVLTVVVYLARSDGVLESDAGAGAPEQALRGRGTARLRRLLAWVAFIVPYLFLYLPLFVIVLFSFNSSDVQALPITGLTTHWYEVLFSDDALMEALRRTLVVGASAVAIGTFVGTWFALLFAGSRHRGMTVLQGALALPVLLPGMVLGISLAITFREIGVESGMIAVVIGHATFVTPVIMLVVLARLRRLDPSLVQASMDCGAGHVRTLWHVVLPQIRSALLGGAILGFTLSFDEIIVTFFLAGDAPTLPVFIWNQLRFGFTPQVNAVFTLIGVGSLVLVLIAGRVLRADLGRGDRRTAPLPGPAALGEAAPGGSLGDR
jgi:spermidine/putrescine transport system permease protein